MQPTLTTDRRAARREPRLLSVPWLLGLLALWLLATLGLRPLLLPDEGRYADVARSMLGGDALVPKLDGLPFFHKPPLFYWLDLAALRVTGVHEFGGRFGSAVGAWLMGAALLLALRRWHGARSGAIALGVIATTPFFYVAAQYANHDMLVGGLITVAVLAFARALEDHARIDRRWLVVGWVACALALLAKGLIGIVLPALVIGPWLIAQRRWRALFGLLHPLGLAAFALVAAPWCIAMQLRYPGFYDYFFIEQHFRRYTGSQFNNAHGLWFFIAVMPLATLPWSLWLPAAIRRAWAGRGAMPGLYAWWIVAVLGFFSLPASKLVGYALPALAPWCALLALAIADPLRPARRPAWHWLMPAAALLCVTLVGYVAWKAPQSNRALGLALREAKAADDSVVMVDEYFYDVPFYARLDRPVVIASRWDDPEVPRRDNWRKELYDAARFDPALGERLLRPLDRLEALTCGAAGAVWFVVRPGEAARVAALRGATRSYGDVRAELWRVPGRAACRAP